MEIGFISTVAILVAGWFGGTYIVKPLVAKAIRFIKGEEAKK